MPTNDVVRVSFVLVVLALSAVNSAELSILNEDPGPATFSKVLLPVAALTRTCDKWSFAEDPI